MHYTGHAAATYNAEQWQLSIIMYAVLVYIQSLATV